MTNNRLLNFLFSTLTSSISDNSSNKLIILPIHKLIKLFSIIHNSNQPFSNPNQKFLFILFLNQLSIFLLLKNHLNPFKTFSQHIFSPKSVNYNHQSFFYSKLNSASITASRLQQTESFI